MCDTFASRGPAGTLFAKNSDRPPNEPQVVEWHAAGPSRGTVRTQYLEIDDVDRCGVLLSRPTWLFGAEHGVNEHGVAIGNEQLYNVRDPAAPEGLIGMDLVRLALERSQTADDACDVLTSLLEAHGQGGACAPDGGGYDSSFLIADPTGGWVVETSGRDWAAARFDDGSAISNRYTLGDRWSRSAGLDVGVSVEGWHDPATDTRLADHRLEATSACVRTAPSPEQAVATLRHHGDSPWGAPGRPDDAQPPPPEVRDDLSGITVCMHVRDLSVTTASMVALLPDEPGAPVRVWACLGSPCVGVYVPFPLDAAPSVLADPATWEATTGLRDRVEADGAELDAIRSATGPLEAELWERAERRWDEGASLDVWKQFGDDAGGRLRNVLHAATAR